MIHAWKVLTHDLRLPVQGGEPVFDGKLPYVLSPAAVDDSPADCAAGWNACASPETALRIAGIWPNGRPARLFHVETGAEVVGRGNKLRAAAWTITAEATEDEVRAAIRALSAPFGDLADEITEEQLAWRAALARPGHDAAAVEAGLRTALKTRRLSAWTTRSFACAEDAWAAWAAWAARDALAAGDARAARGAWDAWAAWAARDAWDAWDARDAWAARAAGDAWAAITAWYAAKRGWVQTDPLTTGIRDAYTAGLGVAIPTGPDELGWAMEDSDA